MSAKRSFWATVGKVLWTMISFVFKVAARLGSKWARRKLDNHDAKTSGNPITRTLHRRGRS